MTGNRQFNCLSQFNHNCQSYIAERGSKVHQKTMESLIVAGRLASFVNAWKVLTGDLRVLDTVVGNQIPFKKTSRDQVLRSSVERIDRITPSKENHLSPQVHNPEGFYSVLFLVPKENGQMDEPETAYPVGGNPSLQDGWNGTF